MAEREGFEPSEGYKPSHDFESCAFNRSATSPVFRGVQASRAVPVDAGAAFYINH